MTAVVAVVPYRPPAPFVLPGARRRPRPGAGVLHVAAGPAGGRRRRRPRRGGGARPRLRALAGQQPAGADRARWTPPPSRAAADEVGRERRLAAPGRRAAVAGRRRRRGRTRPARLERRGAAADGPPGRPARPDGERAEVVDQREVHEFWERSWRRDLAGDPRPRQRGRRAGRAGAPQRPGRRGHRRRRPRGGPGRRVRPAPGRRRDGRGRLGADRSGGPRAAGTPTPSWPGRWTWPPTPGATSSSWRRRPTTGRGTGTPGAASRWSGPCGTSTGAP